MRSPRPIEEKAKWVCANDDFQASEERRTRAMSCPRAVGMDSSIEGDVGGRLHLPRTREGQRQQRGPSPAVHRPPSTKDASSPRTIPTIREDRRRRQLAPIYIHHSHEDIDEEPETRRACVANQLPSSHVHRRLKSPSTQRWKWCGRRGSEDFPSSRKLCLY